MVRLLRFYQSSVGKKVAVAVTGAIMYGFIIGHMLGNLKAFAGPTALDQYAEMLREIGQAFIGHGTFLWIARIVLIFAIVLHVVTIIQLVRRNRRAQPTRPSMRRNKSTLAAKWMAISGTLILVFVVIHLAQFTFGWITPHASGTADFEVGKVYSNLWGAFNIWWVAGFYIFMMLMVCMHVYHGAWSMFQTLGLDAPDRNNILRGSAAATAIVLFIGFSAVPICMVTNAIGAPDQDVANDVQDQPKPQQLTVETGGDHEG